MYVRGGWIRNISTFSFFLNLLEQDAGDVPYNVLTACELFFRFYEQTVYKLQTAFLHPFRASLRVLVKSAVEVEHSSHGNGHSSVDVRHEPVHENLLLGGTKGNPYNIGVVLIYDLAYSFVVKLLHFAERQLNEFHVGNPGVHPLQVLLHGVKSFLFCTKEYHAVLAFLQKVREDGISAVAFVSYAIYPFYEDGYPAAVRYGKHALVNHIPV